jgi:hypothetical protein
LRRSKCTELFVQAEHNSSDPLDGRHRPALDLPAFQRFAGIEARRCTACRDWRVEDGIKSIDKKGRLAGDGPCFNDCSAIRRLSFSRLSDSSKLRRVGSASDQWLALPANSHRQCDRIGITELRRPGLQSAVAGDFIVFDCLSRRDEASVESDRPLYSSMISWPSAMMPWMASQVLPRAACR